MKVIMEENKISVAIVEMCPEQICKFMALYLSPYFHPLFKLSNLETNFILPLCML